MTNLAEYAGLLITVVLVICALYSLTGSTKNPIVTYVGLGVILSGILVYYLAY